MSDPNSELLGDSSAAQEAQDEEGVSEDQEQDQNFDEDEPYTNSEEEIVEEKKQRQQQSSIIQEQPGEQLSRQQKRHPERPQQQRKIPERNDKRNRPPQEAPVDTAIERYSEVDNPSAQLLPAGVEASRAQQLLAAGELQGIGRKTLMKAASRMQAYRTAFIEWQSQRDDFVIFANVGRDEQTGKDRWEANHYSLHFLTMGQDEKLRDMAATLEDLRRAKVNNDTTVKDVNAQIRKFEKAILKFKLRTYFRMYIGEINKQTGMLDPDDEFERSSSVDVRDMIDSAEWAFTWVPKSRRIKPSADSSSKASENEYDMIR